MKMTTMMLVVAGVVALLVAAPGGANAATIGGMEVSEEAAAFSAISEQVCQVFAAMEFEPVDWSSVVEIYEAPFEINGESTSLKEIATEGPVSVGGDDDNDVWEAFQDYFDDEDWLDTNVLEGGEDLDNETDGARTELVQKTSRDALGVALTLAFLEDAAEALDDGDVEQAILFTEIAWVIYHGYDNGDGDTGNGCAPYGTGESRSGNFGLPGDVTANIESAFSAAMAALSVDAGGGAASDAQEEILENLLDTVARAVTITYLRAALRYGVRMDGDAAAGNPDNLRVNQLEGLAFFRVIEPLVASFDEDLAEAVESFFVVSNYEPDESGEIDLSDYEDIGADLEAVIDEILETLGVDKEVEFGSLQ